MRLVDADALLEDVRNNMPNYELKSDFLLFIHAQPTAYDVEAVESRIRHDSVSCDDRNEVLNFDVFPSHWGIDMEKAIEIVRRGEV